MSAVREAARRSLVGWIRNLPAGSVLLEAQGPAGELEAFLAWCRRGPVGAHVASVDLEWLPEVAGEDRFEIRH